MEGISTYPGSRKCTIATLCCSVALLSLVCIASKQFAKPAAQPAKTYPAHDEHPTEGVTLAIDPYDMADKAQIFSVNHRDEGFLPAFLAPGTERLALSSSLPAKKDQGGRRQTGDARNRIRAI